VALLKWTRLDMPAAISSILMMDGRYEFAPPPMSAKWKAAVERVKRGQTWAQVREHAREWFLSF
tara:strand:- start:2117 stop:2308 length:192 start_codon:yes stop_codon:yes gene_type:complete